jgi:hypothetical protein
MRYNCDLPLRDKMSKNHTYLTGERSELVRAERNAKWFAAEYRKYRTRKSDLAGPYKIMATNAEAKVRRLKRHIGEMEAIQKRIDALTLRIAEIDAKPRSR